MDTIHKEIVYDDVVGSVPTMIYRADNEPLNSHSCPLDYYLTLSWQGYTGNLPCW